MTTTQNSSTPRQARLSDHGTKVRTIFSRMAPKYSLFNHLASFGIHRLWLKRTTRLAERYSHGRILDLAAGTGDLTYEMCKMNPVPQQIWCTDFCPEMLEIAHGRYQAQHRGVEIAFDEVDAMHLPYEDESFDLVTVGYGVRNFDNRSLAFAEAMRVLKPGGAYIILDFSTPPNRIWRAVYYTYLRFVIPALGFVLRQDLDQFYYFINSIKTFPPQETLVRELQEAGFDRVRYHNCSGGITAIHCGRKPRN